jgi:hypothetical protein
MYWIRLCDTEKRMKYKTPTTKIRDMSFLEEMRNKTRGLLFFFLRVFSIIQKSPAVKEPPGFLFS